MVKRVDKRSYNMSGYRWYSQMSCQSYRTEDFTRLSLRSIVITTLIEDWFYCSELFFSLIKVNKFCLNCLLFIMY